MFFSADFAPKILSHAGAAGAGLCPRRCSGADKGETGTAIELTTGSRDIAPGLSIWGEIKGGMDARMDHPPGDHSGTVEWRAARRGLPPEDGRKYIYPPFDAAKRWADSRGAPRTARGRFSIDGNSRRRGGVFGKGPRERPHKMGSAITSSAAVTAHADEGTPCSFGPAAVVAPPGFRQIERGFLKDDASSWGKTGFDEPVQKLAALKMRSESGTSRVNNPRMEELR